MTDYQANNKKIAKNTAFLYVRMFFVLFVNLYISRILLDAFGVTDYGVYVVITGFVTFFSFLNATLASTMQRYYNYSGTKHAAQGIQDVFSTGCYIHGIIALIAFLLLETVGIWYMNHYIVIPDNRFGAGSFLFQASSVSLLFIIIQIPFVGLIIAKERMGFYALVSMTDISLKLIASLLVKHLPYDNIKAYAMMLLIVSLTDFLLYAGYVIKNYPSLHLSRHINKELTRSLTSFAGWNLVGTFAFMLKGQGISLLLNNFFGPIVNAGRGIAMQVSSAVSGFSGNITIAFTPQIVNSVAADDNAHAKSMMFNESRICYTLIMLLTVPLCLEIDYILKIWLSINIPVDTNIFTILMLIDTTICTLNTPCTQITQATGKIRQYQIASTIVNLGLIPVCYVFLKLGFSAKSSFVITIVFSIINQTVCLYNTNLVFKFHLSDYMRSVVLPCLTCTIVLPILPLLVKHMMNPSFLRLVLTTATDIAVGLALFYFLLLKRNERKVLREYIAKKVNLRNTV